MPALGVPLPTADQVAAHTLLNCLLREVSTPGGHTAVHNGYLVLRLPHCATTIRIRLRRVSILGAHRFTGPAARQLRPDGDWATLSALELAELVHAELTALTGVPNDEFLAQFAASHANIAAALQPRPPAPDCRYLESEQALVFGHRFHPTPKARDTGDTGFAAYAPESRAAFPLRYLAVRTELIAGQRACLGADLVLDRLRPVPDGYTLLPAHPWQYRLLAGRPSLRAALDRGDILDLGSHGPAFTATASVRTLHSADAFLKFSLNIRITNCIRKNAAYELAGAVALTRLLRPALDDLAARFPGHAVLLEPAYRSADLGDPALLEGLGVIVRDSLARYLRPGATPLLAAAVADEYPTSSAHISRLLDGTGPRAALDWWEAFLRLLLPPVLAAYLDHGIVFEPHLQNVLICVDNTGFPVQLLFRDLEGTKLLRSHHAAVLAALPADVAASMTYDQQRGWNRVVYCLLVNTVADTLAALADRHPQLETALWGRVRTVLHEHALRHGCPAPLRDLLSGSALPAKANLRTRWQRSADRDAGYVRIPSPLAETPALPTPVTSLVAAGSV